MPNFELDDADMFARWLLEQGMHLTALELHQELLLNHQASIPVLESFMRGDVLGDHLSKEVRAASIDSMILSTNTSPFEHGGIMDIIQTRDDKIALLEYELRCSREDLSAMRGRVRAFSEAALDGTESYINRKDNTVQQSTNYKNPFSKSQISNKLSSDSKNPFSSHNSSQSSGQHSADNKDMTRQERNILNCIVKRYLENSGYKLSCLTFSEEVNDQDLDDLESLGLSSGNRADLVSLYRGRIDPIRDALSLQVDLNRERRLSAKLKASSTAAINEAEESREFHAKLSKKFQVILDETSQHKEKIAEMTKQNENLKEMLSSLRDELDLARVCFIMNF